MPLHYKADIEQGILGVWEIQESSDEMLAKLEISEQDIVRVDSFKLETRKQEYLASRLLIKELINIDPVIKYLPSGKPVLENSNSYISISHTKGYAAVVISEKDKAGIDIEIPSERVRKVSSRFVSSVEDSFIPEDKRIEYYTLMWSLKEAMYKIYDEKNVIFNVDLVCKPFELCASGSMEAIFDKDGVFECLTYNYITTSDYFLVYHG